MAPLFWPPKTVPVFVDQWSGKEWHSFRGPKQTLLRGLIAWKLAHLMLIHVTP